MPDSTRAVQAAAGVFALVWLLAVPAAAQTKGGGKIVCWKDQSGRIVGCGDTVPPEYRSSGTKELDARGITRKTTESAASEAARKKAGEPDPAARKAEETRRLAEQKRQDAALLGTYSNEKEIDAKRDRDLADTDVQLQQMQAALKVSTNRLEQAKKGGNKDEIARAETDRAKIEKNVAAKQKELEEIREKYAAQKKRFQELKGTPAAAVPAAAAAKK